jgi:trigger factor
MQVQIEELSPVQKKLSFTVEATEVASKLTEAYRNLGKQVRMKGFRAGKVPRKVLEKRFGKQIASEVGSQVISDAFDEAIKEHDLSPVSQPDVSPGQMTDGQDYTFEVTVEVKPQLTIAGWDGMDVQWPAVEVDDTQVMAELELMRQREAVVEVADEAYEAAEGDMVFVKLTARTEGQDDKSLDNLMMLAGGETGLSTADWVAGHVVGLKAGDAKDFEGEVPEGVLGDEWAGKTAACTVEVTEIKLNKVPDLDDDFAQDVGFDTLDLLKADIRFKMEEAEGNGARSRAAEWALDQLVASNEFEVPAGLVRSEAETMLAQNLQQFAAQGLQVRQMRIKDLPEETQQRMLGEAEVSVRRALVLEAIAEEVELVVTDEDLDAKIDEIAAELGQQPSAVKGLLAKRGGTNELRGRLREEKALDLLLEKANVIDWVEPEPEADADEAGADAADEPAADAE